MEEQASPGLRSAIAKEVIEEGEEEDQEEQDSKLKTGQRPGEGKHFPSVMSGQGMRSGRTLNNEMSGSEMGTSQSPSYKSLMRSKNNQQPNESFQEQLKQSQQQNSRRPGGPSGIKKLLRREFAK